MNQKIKEQLNLLHEGIRMDMPLVADFFDMDTPLAKYTTDLQEYSVHPKHKERQDVLQQVVRSELEKTFTKEEIEEANIDWGNEWKLNIVDHHGLLNHPILLSANIIANMFQLPAEKPKGVVVLSDSGVPLNNFFHKRGLKFKGKQLNIVPSRDRHIMSYAGKLREYFPLVKAAQRQNFFSDDLQFLQQMQEQLDSTADDAQCQNYKNQVQRINYMWWRQLFAEDIRENIPQMMYVPNEDLGVGLLKEYLKDENNVFYRLLCDADVREIIVKEFMNLTGCWDADGKRGTVFFWGIDSNQRKIAMHYKKGALVSENAADEMRIELNPQAILEAINQGRLYPNMFLVYGMANFYCGVRPLVGYGSMNYQTKMKEAWIQALHQIDPKEVECVQSVSTTGFIGGPMVTYAWSEQHGYRELYALDIMQRGGYSEQYLQQLRQMPLNAVLQPALIDIYESYVRPEHKQPITITPNDLMGEAFAWLKDMQV